MQNFGPIFVTRGLWGTVATKRKNSSETLYFHLE